MNDIRAISSPSGSLVADRSADFVVPEMSSRRRADLVRASIRMLDGIKAVHTNLAAHLVTVHFNPQLTDLGEIKSAIEQAGCEVADLSELGMTIAAQELHVLVPQMACAYCADHLTRSLKRIPGIFLVRTDLSRRNVQVGFAPGKVKPALIRAAIERSGYEVAGIGET